MPFQDILTRHTDLRKRKYQHEILVRGTDFKACRKKVLHFFKKYQLVRYSSIRIFENESVSASGSGFDKRLRKAILKNRKILHDLIKELQEEGVTMLEDLNVLPQGYQSKMLHVITHFLDGFFGIDTYFYNLEDDSHWVSEEFQEKIHAMPSHYWIVTLEAEI